MVSKPKLASALQCHLTPEYANAVKNLAYAADMKPSHWLRRLVVAEINRQHLQAKATLAATESLEIESLESLDEDDDDDL